MISPHRPAAKGPGAETRPGPGAPVEARIGAPPPKHPTEGTERREKPGNGDFAPVDRLCPALVVAVMMVAWSRESGNRDGKFFMEKALTLYRGTECII